MADTSCGQDEIPDGVGLEDENAQDLDCVGRGSGIAAVTCPIGMEKLATGLVHPLISVGSEEVALRLQEIGGQNGCAVAVVERKRSAEGGNGNSAFGSEGHHIAPAFLALLDFIAEIAIEKKVCEFWVVVEGFFDFSQKA